jgi:uncharacterized cupin superfamily protein/glyoxylase-like metal-dependent hydrolase (beta-lactamase superfamily II)
MRQTVVPGVWSWSRWQPDRNLDFNGFFVETSEGNLVVDPIDPDEALLTELRARGVAAVIVTNRDHERGSAAVAVATGARVLASALDAPEMQRPPDVTLQPEELVHGWRVLGFEGLKTRGEIALFDPERKAVIVGDAIWGTPAGALTLMPEAKLGDPTRALLSLRRLRAIKPSHVLVGDGASVFGNAYAVLNAMFAAREGVATFRVNVDELRFFTGNDAPLPFRGCQSAEVGQLLGAEQLGYAMRRVPPGVHVCPMHWHGSEEELFVVLRGSPTLRTPQGTFILRMGDMVAFPTGPAGAHRLWNDTDEDVDVLMIARYANETDVCFYPDSDKVLIEASDTIVRSSPALDYYDGEV